MQITVTPARAKLPQEEPRLQQPLLPDTVREAEVEVIDDSSKGSK
jgi:hypothetical protein